VLQSPSIVSTKSSVTSTRNVGYAFTYHSDSVTAATANIIAVLECCLSECFVVISFPFFLIFFLRHFDVILRQKLHPAFAVSNSVSIQHRSCGPIALLIKPVPTF